MIITYYYIDSYWFLLIFIDFYWFCIDSLLISYWFLLVFIGFNWFLIGFKWFPNSRARIAALHGWSHIAIQKCQPDEETHRQNCFFFFLICEMRVDLSIPAIGKNTFFRREKSDFWAPSQFPRRSRRTSIRAAVHFRLFSPNLLIFHYFLWIFLIFFGFYYFSIDFHWFLLIWIDFH